MESRYDRSSTLDGSRAQSHQRRFLKLEKATNIARSEIDYLIEDLDKTHVLNQTIAKGPFSVFRIATETGPESLVHTSTDRFQLSGRGVLPLRQQGLDEIVSGLSCDSVDQTMLSLVSLDHELDPGEHQSPVTPQAETQLNNNLASYFGVEAESSPPPSTPEGLRHSANTFSPVEGEEELPRVQISGEEITNATIFPYPERSLYEHGFFSGLVRHLLKHYHQQVLHVFSVLDNKHTPWHKIHLPLVFQCIGELELTGTAPDHRQALFHAILSISAHNLRNKHSRQGQLVMQRQWMTVASQHRLLAVIFLRKSTDSSRKPQSLNDYKGLLASMLSMITICVISGDTETCSVHLKGCESLIMAYPEQQSEFTKSRQVRALHRIFFYLRVMQIATDWTCNHYIPTWTMGVRATAEDWSYIDSLYPASLEVLRPYVNVDEGLQEPWESSCELIYGTPPHLLFLLSKTCGLLARLRREPACGATSLASDQLEQEILEWSAENVMRNLDTRYLSVCSRRILEHHMCSFHQALVIFFCRGVRNMHRQHVQPYVRQLIHHLHLVEELKEQENIYADSILWPVFVAGVEAIGEDLRASILKWFETVEPRGVGTARRAREALQLMWQSFEEAQSPISPAKFLPANFILS